MLPNIRTTLLKLVLDPNSYGFLEKFRSQPPLIPGQIYSLDMKTGVVRVMADGFDKPNGIAFTPDGKTAYM
jgi:gluconolactonase